MSKVILHIGAGKTGSTSIQHSLSYNSKTLEKFDILYPRFKNVTRDYGLIDHNRLAYAIFDDRATADIDEVKNKLQSLATIGKTIVLSGEVFYMLPHEKKYINYDDYVIKKTEAIRKTAELLSCFDEIKIICYIRRQDLWFESIYNEQVKTWKHSGKSFSNIVKNTREYHFIEQIDLWAECFDKESMIIRPYEREQLVNSNVIDDFYYLLGINDTSGEIRDVPENIITTNVRLTRDVLEFQKIVYKLDLDSFERRIWHDALLEISGRLYSTYGEQESWNKYMDYDERVKLLQKYKEANEKIASKYMNKRNTVAFRQPGEYKNEDMYPGLKIDKAFEIIFLLSKILSRPETRIRLYSEKLQYFVRKYIPILRPFLSPFSRYLQRINDRKKIGYE